jgi:uncharacterized Tic20 family protein
MDNAPIVPDTTDTTESNEITRGEKLLAVLCHAMFPFPSVLVLVAERLLGAPWPVVTFVSIASWLTPVLVLIVASSEFARAHARSAINARISYFFYSIPILELGHVLGVVFLLILFRVIYTMISLVAAIKAARGRSFRYPLTYAFLKG